MSTEDDIAKIQAVTDKLAGEQVVDAVTAKLVGRFERWLQPVECKVEWGQFMVGMDTTPEGGSFDDYSCEPVYLPIYKTGRVIGVHYIERRPVRLEIE